MVQVACAVVAVGIGAITQWQQLTTAIDPALIFKIALYPLAAIILVQIGKHYPGSRATVQSSTTVPAAIQQPKQPDKSKPASEYTYLSQPVKVGSYIEVNQEYGLRRVTLMSIQSRTIGSEEVLVAELEATGMAVSFAPGKWVEQITDRRFLVPANSRELKSEGYAFFEFMFGQSSLSMTSVCVDHINQPAQEATIVVGAMRYRSS